jgi:putative transposase
VTPVASADVVRKSVYVLANPVSAGLVRTARDWPGLWTSPDQLGATVLTAPRPKVFFSPTGGMPASATLELTTPPGFSSAEEFRALVAAGFAEHEAEHRRATEAEGRGFLGRANVLAQKPFARPAPGEPRRQLSPRVAGRDKWKRIEALARLVEFLGRYRAAWRALRSGDLGAVFPAGTYQLRIAFGVRCAPA